VRRRPQIHHVTEAGFPRAGELPAVELPAKTTTLTPMPDGDDLLRCLAALQRSQAGWLADVAATAGEDPAFAPAFRRWQEELTQTKLHLHRCEARLLQFVLNPQTSLQREVVVPSSDGYRSAHSWRRRLDAWFDLIRLDRTYRRIEHCRDLDAEPITADIVTDLTILAELSEQTAPILTRIAQDRDLAAVQDLAFFGVLSPWRVRGLPALNDTLRWISETLSEEGEW
jgi:hypothetical protein